MQGVEILSTTTHYETEILGWVWWIYFAVVALSIVVACVWSHLCDGDFMDKLMWGVAVGMIVLLVGVFPTAICSSKRTDKIDYYKHKVTLDETVNMEEFLDKYEIIEQDGKLITVIEDVE